MMEKATQSVVFDALDSFRFLVLCRISWGNVTELSAKDYIDHTEVLAVSPLICFH